MRLPNTWTHSANTSMAYPPAAGSPQPRSFPGMSTDQQGGVLMFGGGDSGSTALNETWEWSGAWSKKAVAIAPPARAMAQMAFDSACKLVVLYGGELQTGQNLTQFYDTWVWDGQAWSKVG
ncbi:MAG TPA: kelch repeat-containing protein [Candidatus Dormibacteraeota bacterium]|nr:kelch repeat-containing protein [Candidatus Dormibacteraeota bacterium]